MGEGQGGPCHPLSLLLWEQLPSQLEQKRAFHRPEEGPEAGSPWMGICIPFPRSPWAVCSAAAPASLATAQGAHQPGSLPRIRAGLGCPFQELKPGAGGSSLQFNTPALKPPRATRDDADPTLEGLPTRRTMDHVVPSRKPGKPLGSKDTSGLPLATQANSSPQGPFPLLLSAA